MARRTMMNKYRQVPVQRAEEPKERPWQPREKRDLAIGDAVTCSLRNPLVTMPPTCIVEDIQPSKLYVSGWKVMVKDVNGREKWIDSWYFNRINQPG